MSGALIGMGVSILYLGILYFLFRYEERSGHRFLSVVRTWCDHTLSSLHYSSTLHVRRMVNGYVRQTMHYLLHTFLHVLLARLHAWEERIRQMIRANKTYARLAVKRHESRSHLEEVFRHKEESALSDKEKRIHKEKSLNGF